MGYRADGTIHVQTGKTKAVIFIPEKYVEQSGNKFAFFLPSTTYECGQAKQEVVKGIFVRAEGGGGTGVPLNAANFSGEDLLHMAAIKAVKVTVIVSCSKNGGESASNAGASASPDPKLQLDEIIVPAISAKRET